MLFNSLQFLLFFPIVIVLYFAISYKYRWLLLLLASYYFYMCWKPEYIVLIIFSTLIDYYSAIQIENSFNNKRKKFFLLVSLTTNLGLLFSFKYLNFFSDSTRYFLEQFNIMVDVPYFDYLLPVGISFYTFQTLSYTIDVYRGETKAEKHLGIFALYVSFFPQLVAGPIERSSRLLPQFRQKYNFNYTRVKEGLLLILWGFFKKVVIADRLAWFVNEVYNEPEKFQGFSIIIATYFFAFQIYCDFSGYSDIAIGTARVMGYNLMDNFKRPYFSRSISVFWKRWHISLSSWFRDYLYIPLGGNKVSKLRLYFNLNLVFLLSGLWHGANWTFIMWGGLHGFYLTFAVVFKTLKLKFNSLFKRLRFANHALDIFITFHLVLIGWVFFRANSISDAFLIFKRGSQINLNQLGPYMFGANMKVELILAFIFIFVMEASHVLQEKYNVRNKIIELPILLRWSVYILSILIVLFFGVFGSQEFIYFQF